MNGSAQTTMKLSRLGEVARFLRGITFKPVDLVAPGTTDSVVCMRTKNIQSDLDQTDLIAVPKEFVRRQELYLQESDILVSTANSWELVGKCCWVPKLDYSATAGGFISVLRANPKLVLPRYLYHWFNSETTQRHVRNCGRQTTNISNMSFERCEALQIPLPPLAEQKRIADILDKADGIRRKRREAARHSEKVGNAMFLQMFGEPGTNTHKWSFKPLSTLVRNDDKINYGVVQPGHTHPNGIPIVRVGDFAHLTHGITTLKTIDPRIDELHKRSRLVGDEVLLACVGSIGRVALAVPALKGCNTVRAVARIRCGSEIDRVFLSYYLQLPWVQSYFATETRTVSQPTLNIRQIENTPVFVTPMALQKKFSEVVQKTMSASETSSAATRMVDAVFASLTHHAFTATL